MRAQKKPNSILSCPFVFHFIPAFVLQSAGLGSISLPVGPLRSFYFQAWDFQDASFTTSCLPATGAREATLHPFQPRGIRINPLVFYINRTPGSIYDQDPKAGARFGPKGPRRKQPLEQRVFKQQFQAGSSLFQPYFLKVSTYIKRRSFQD